MKHLVREGRGGFFLVIFLLSMTFYREQHLLEFFLTIMKKFFPLPVVREKTFFTDPINSSIHKFHDSMSLAQIIDPVSFINITIAVNIKEKSTKLQHFLQYAQELINM